MANKTGGSFADLLKHLTQHAKKADVVEENYDAAKAVVKQHAYSYERPEEFRPHMLRKMVDFLEMAKIPNSAFDMSKYNTEYHFRSSGDYIIDCNKDRNKFVEKMLYEVSGCLVGKGIYMDLNAFDMLLRGYHLTKACPSIFIDWATNAFNLRSDNIFFMFMFAGSWCHHEPTIEEGIARIKSVLDGTCVNHPRFYEYGRTPEMVKEYERGLMKHGWS